MGCIMAKKQRILRPLADGTLSYCTASEDRIGKGRCCHIVGQCVCMEEEKLGVKKYGQEVSIPDIDKMSQSEKVDNICQTLGGMHKITPAQKKRILDHLECVKVKKK